MIEISIIFSINIDNFKVIEKIYQQELESKYLQLKIKNKYYNNIRLEWY